MLKSKIQDILMTMQKKRHGWGNPCLLRVLRMVRDFGGESPLR